MNPIVISFYTLGTPYEEEVKKLILSCVELEIESDIAAVIPQGSWERNCALKAAFILEKMHAWNRPVLWVDADAVFLQRPDFSEFADCDFSVRVNEFLPVSHPSRIVSNTVFVKNNTRGVALLEKWGEETDKQLNAPGRVLEFWDQAALRDVLQKTADLKFFPMPLKYSKIFDFDDLFISEQEVVIEHYQASRRLKAEVHGKKGLTEDHCCC